MSIIHNIRIGTKLAVSALLSILLIAGMIYAQVAGNAAVGKANEAANNQQTIARDAIDTKASIRGMQTGARDIRLANTPADLQKAGDYIAARLKSVNEFTQEMLKLAHSPENRERIAKVETLAGEYAKAMGKIAAIRSELIGIEGKRTVGGELPADATAIIAKLNDEGIRVAREVTLPMAARAGIAREQDRRLCQAARGRGELLHQRQDHVFRRKDRADRRYRGGVAADRSPACSPYLRLPGR